MICLKLHLPVEGSDEDMWSSFHIQFLLINQRRIPRKRIRRIEQVQLSWFHGGIGCEVKKRKLLHHAAKSNSTPENERRIYIQRRVVKKMVRHAKVAEEHRVTLACHDNPKDFFGYANKHKPRAPLGPVFSSDGHFVTDGEVMARELNNYFSNVFTVEDVDNIPDPVIVHAGENTLTNIDCALHEVEAKLKEPKPDFPPSYSTTFDFPSSYSTIFDFPLSYSAIFDFPPSYSTIFDFPLSYSTIFDSPPSYSTIFEFPPSYLFNYDFPPSYSTIFDFPLSNSIIFDFPSSYSTIFDFPSSYSTIFDFPSPYSTIFDFPSSYSSIFEFPSSY